LTSTQTEGIVAQLTRRDNQPESDYGSIRIDSYHDNQTAYEFTFNPAGVRRDVITYDDGDKEDGSWDPVWELQTKITDKGWVAEIKIPFAVLRYRALSIDSTDNVWGINFIRIISRKQETDRWAFSPKKESGFISRFGHLTGLLHLPEPKRIEALPFMIGKQSYIPATLYQSRNQQFQPNAGLDLKYGLASNFTIDATVNPDFGQVEADPAVLNLSTFETFYPEKRPFFIEGTQILHFTTFGGDFGPGMFYSRRIGRAISESEVSVGEGGRIVDIPQRTTILGAAKLTGKTEGRLSVGVLEAFTQEAKAVVADSAGKESEQVLEPFAHYNVIRLKQDIMENSNVGMMLTSVAKNSRSPAFTNGYDWNLKFGRNAYSLIGFLALSDRTNPEGERVTGSAGKMAFSKIAGEHWLWTLSTDYTSKKYNINDVGFFLSPNDVGGVGTLTYKEDAPAKVLRNYNIGFTLHGRQNFDAVNLDRAAQVNAVLLFSNYWRMSFSAGADEGLYDPRETRGNGLYRRPVGYSSDFQVSTDYRNPIVLSFEQTIGLDDKRTRRAESKAEIQLRPLSWMEWYIDPGYRRTRNQEAWVMNDGLFSVFGDRSTDEYNLTLRSTITFTRELTLQLYTQVFLAKGHYENYRLLVGTSDFMAPGKSYQYDFNEHFLNTNLVLRWEYLPGSTLFLVWSQARSGGNQDYFTGFGRDFRDTFSIPPSNVILLKASYWLSI